MNYGPKDVWALSNLAKVTMVKQYQPTQDDLVILALTAWGEARGDSRMAMAATMGAMLNRVRTGVWANRQLESYHDAELRNSSSPIIHTVMAPKQFSCWNSNDPNYPKMRRMWEQYQQTGQLPQDRDFQIAYQDAINLVSGKMPDPSNGADIYNARSVFHGQIPGGWGSPNEFVRVHTPQGGDHDYYNELRGGRRLAQDKIAVGNYGGGYNPGFQYASYTPDGNGFMQDAVYQTGSNQAGYDPTYVNMNTVNASWLELAYRQGKKVPGMPDFANPSDDDMTDEFGNINPSQFYASIGPAAAMNASFGNGNAQMINCALYNKTTELLGVRYSQDHSRNISNPTAQGWSDCSHFTTYLMNGVGLKHEWVVSGMQAQTYCKDFGLPGGHIPAGQVTMDKLPLYGVVSLIRHDRGTTNNHVGMVTVGPDGRRYFLHCTSREGSDGMTGVNIEPLEKYIRSMNSFKMGVDFADITGKMTGDNQYAMMASMQNQWGAQTIPDIDPEFKKSLLRDAIVMPSNGITMAANGNIMMNGLIFQLAFDNNRNAAIQGSEVLQTAANQFTINIPANMTASWAMFSAISKMAKQAGVDPGQAQIDLAKEMIRTKGDDSYFRFLQRTPAEYGFGKYKAMQVPTQAQLQAEYNAKHQQAPAPQQQYVATTPDQDRDTLLRQSGQNGQNVSFASGGEEAPQGRISAEYDPRKTMEAAYQLLPQNLKNIYSISGEEGKIMLLPTDKDGTPIMPARMRNLPRTEMFEVFNNETPQDLAERILGRHQMNQAMAAQAPNVTQLHQQTTPA